MSRSRMCRRGLSARAREALEAFHMVEPMQTTIEGALSIGALIPCVVRRLDLDASKFQPCFEVGNFKHRRSEA